MPLLARTVGTAKELPVRLETVAQDPTVTVLAYWSNPLCGTLNAVENVNDTCGADLERHLVVVAAHFAHRH